MLNAILGPVAGALGADYAPSSVDRNSPRARKRTDAEKDEALLRALSKAPIGVRTVKTSGEPG